MNRIVQSVKRRLNRPSFATKDVKIGRNASFGRNVVFRCEKVRIGDGAKIGDDVLVAADSFEVGDYATIYDRCFFPGPGEIKIGHNFWLGSASIVDSQGGTAIADNAGVGAHSQLWTHIAYGDTLYGCRFHGAKPLRIEKDAWLVGHCLLSPVTVGARSMAMLGSVVTKDMAPDRVYAGCPARDVTEKFGPQFEIRPVAERARLLEERLEAFARAKGIDGARRFARVATGRDGAAPKTRRETVFNVEDRTYTKRGTALEWALMRFLLPDAKFTPEE